MSSPFNKNRYERLLRGLEATEVNIETIATGTETFRFDPEYFKKQHLEDTDVVIGHPERFGTFKDLGLRVDASAFYPSIEEFYDSGDLPFLRVSDVDSIIDWERATRVPRELCDTFPTLSKVYPGDIILTKGGTVARIGLVTKEAAVSRDLIFVNSSILPRETQYFLFLFLQTEFCNRMLLRSSSQTAQPHLTITLVRTLPLLKASKSFRVRLGKMVEESFKRRDDALNHLAMAESVFLEELGIATWKPQHQLTYSRDFGSVVRANRFDADFFAPRVQELIAKLNAQKLSISSVATLRKHRFAANEGSQFEYIEIGGLTQYGEAIGNSIDGGNAPSRATWHVTKGDVITSTVRPIRRLSAMIRDEQDGAVCSSGFAVLNPKKIPSEVLLTYLRLPVVCELMDLHTTASMYPAISVPDILNIPFVIPSAIGKKEIVRKVRLSRKARLEAKALLEYAKAAVEMALRDSEESALKILNEN